MVVNSDDKGAGEPTPTPEEQSAKLLEVLTSIGDRFMSLEQDIKDLKAGKDPPSTPDIASLLAELGKEGGKKGSEPKPDDVDLEGVSNTELANIVYQKIQETLIQPIIDRLETQRMKDEIKDCEQKYPDFWDFKKEIWAEGTKNPSLSVEQAYIIVKARSSKQEGAKKGEVGKGGEKPPQVFGEKKGLASSSAKKGEPKTVKEAALQAFEEVFKEEQK